MTKMAKERRGARRVSTNLIARWDMPIPPHEGKIIDLSTSGCFILTAGRLSANKLSRVKQVSVNEAILMRVQLPTHQWLELRAEMVYRIEHVGFAVRFVDLAREVEQALQSFIETQDSGRLETLPFRTAERGDKR